MALCVHDNITITCTVSSTGILVWTLTELVNNSNISESYPYIETSSLPVAGTLGDFELRLKSTKPVVSTATLTDTDPEHNGIVLTCANVITPSQPEQIAVTTLLVKGKLHVCYNSIEVY